MTREKKCDKCSPIKSGILSPAIMYSNDPIEDAHCNLNCAKDKKPNVLITRLAVVIGLVLLGVLACNLYKG